MTRRLLLLLLVVIALAGCRWHAAAEPHATASCTPPVGGRCAGDVPWHGPILLSSDGRRLHARVNCGGVLHATQTDTTVTLRLHVGAMGPGSMSCAVPDIGVRLAAPLGDRTVVDAVGGGVVQVVRAAG
jgi:hypothetical protein